MGQSLTREQRNQVDVLQKILKTYRGNVSQLSLMTLLAWVRDNCSWFPQEGTVNIMVWKHIGDELGQRSDDRSKGLLITSQQVFSALHRLQAVNAAKLAPSTTTADEGTKKPLLKTGLDSEPEDPFNPGPTDLEQEPDLYPPLNAACCTHPTASSGSPPPQKTGLPANVNRPQPPITELAFWAKSIDPGPALPQNHGVLELCRIEALRRGDLDLLRYQAGCPNTWEQLPYEVVKAIRKPVKDFGLQSAYTMNLFQAIAEGYTMTPHDWKALCRITLSAVQYTVWLTEYRDRATAQTMDNLTNMNNIGMDELLGEERYATAIAQVQLPREALDQSSHLALQSLRKVPADKPEQSFASVCQGPQEPYMQFLDRLQNAIDQQVDSEEARRLLLTLLAMENANADCQEALRPLRNANPSLADMIPACQNVGTVSYRAELLAAALSQLMAVAVAQRAPCFSCRQVGHFKKDCKAGGGNGKKPGHQPPNRPCPRCQKGYHWANECRSKFHQNGTVLPPVQGNGRRSARPRTPAINTATMPAQPLTAPDSRLPTCDQQLGEVTAWTWPSPSQS
ncbi:endogenous retrovirus group K member 7 Gag polyprotein-like [Dromaius novaehollandiae]|uniref:endogenous retrovirus group K member 7 Gag polyprotein-like n=1 Tax=Dromaius novaehollandiae TaxID=8790 RepID=UPI00311D3EB0